MKILSKIKTLIQSLRYYVVADPSDNSITLSRALFNHIRTHAREGEPPKVFVFKLSGDVSFAFMLNPPLGDQPTQLCDIQYNERYRTVGFETLCPSVGTILYHYNLPHNCKVKLSVSVCHMPQGGIYYQISKPHEKLIRKLA